MKILSFLAEKKFFKYETDIFALNPDSDLCATQNKYNRIC